MDEAKAVGQAGADSMAPFASTRHITLASAERTLLMALVACALATPRWWLPLLCECDRRLGGDGARRTAISDGLSVPTSAWHGAGVPPPSAWATKSTTGASPVIETWTNGWATTFWEVGSIDNETLKFSAGGQQIGRGFHAPGNAHQWSGPMEERMLSSSLMRLQNGSIRRSPAS